MQANGVEVIDVADREAFRDAVQPVWEKHGAEFAELIERIQDVQ
jgi:TRAP-type C4-dicarboxylate transport system substrate-binding protein